MQTEPAQPQLRGYLLVGLSALGFSTKSVLTKVAFQHGVEPMTFLLMRMFIGAPLFFVALFWMEGRAALRVDPRQLAGAALVGLVGLGGAMYLSFEAIFALTASMATLLVYTYPALTILILFVWLRRISPGHLAAVLVTFAGLILLLEVDQAGALDLDPFGLLAGLGSALCFACYNILSERMMRRLSPLRMSAYSVGAATLGFGLVFGVRSYPDDPLLWGLAATLGIFSGFVSFLAFMYGVRLLGAGRTAVLNSVGPVFTLLWAFLVLGEVLDLLQLLGGATVIAGILVLRLRRT